MSSSGLHQDSGVGGQRMQTEHTSRPRAEVDGTTLMGEGTATHSSSNSRLVLRRLLVKPSVTLCTRMLQVPMLIQSRQGTCI